MISEGLARLWEHWIAWEDTHQMVMSDHYLEQCIEQSIVLGLLDRATRFAFRHSNPEAMFERWPEIEWPPTQEVNFDVESP